MNEIRENIKNIVSISNNNSIFFQKPRDQIKSDMKVCLGIE